MGKFLEGLTIAVTGTFGENRKREEYKRWIEGSGGKFAPTLGPAVTHLVIAEDAWIAKPQMVTDAIEQEKLSLVKQAWLDDALQSHKKPVKKIPNHQNWRLSHTARPSGVKKNVSPASGSKQNDIPAVSRSKMVQALAEEGIKHASSKAKHHKRSKKQKAIASFIDGEFKKSAKAASQLISSKDHHDYIDHSSFKYSIQLLRILHERNLFERVQLRIFESNEVPHTYATVSSLTDIHGKIHSALLAQTGANFPTALRCFKAEFKARTGIEWEDRMNRCKRTKPNGLAVIGLAREKKEFIDPATLYARGGPRHGELVEAVTKDMMARLKARPFTWRAPREGDPEGDDIRAKHAKEEAEAAAKAAAQATSNAPQGTESEQTDGANEDVLADAESMAE